MPLLSEEDLKRLREKPPKTCTECKRTCKENYCRQDDVFFQDGHADFCSTMTDQDPYCTNNHRGHRTY